ncbi:MAG: hypothetical protein IJ318_02725 [Clostridia bacterium]|nr:hypothetical protein [Clostridia bacterium]
MQSNTSKKSNTFVALLMCMLACLAGALLFGLIYHMGYYIYYVTALEIVFGVLAFLKFKKTTSKGAIAFSIILSTVFVVLFNFAAILVVDSIQLAQSYNVTFNEALQAWLESWKTEPEVTAYFNQRTIEIVAMALVGCVVAIFIVIGKVRKNKKQSDALSVQEIHSTQYVNEDNNDLGLIQKQQTSAPIASNNVKDFNNIETTPSPNAQQIFFEYYSQCKVLVQGYLVNKDMTSFKASINTLKQKADQLDAPTKQQIDVIINNELLRPNISSLEIKSLEVLNRMF